MSPMLGTNTCDSNLWSHYLRHQLMYLCPFKVNKLSKENYTKHCL